MRAVWAAAFMLRRLRAERGVVLLLVLLIALTSFLVAAAPRLYNAVADAALREEIGKASTSARNIELVQNLPVPPGEAPADFLDRLGGTFQQQLGGTVESLVASREVVATSPRFRIRELPRYVTYISLRHQTGLDGEVTLREGRWPASTGQPMPPAVLEFEEPPPAPPGGPPRVEIAVSDATAAETGLVLGMVLDGTVDGADPLLAGAPVRPPVARMEVVGIFSVDDPAASVWYSDNRLQQVGANYEADPPIVYATALIAPEAYADVAAANLPFRNEWHYFIDPARLDAGQLDALLPELRRLETTFSATVLGPGGRDRIALRSQLLGVIQAHLAQRAASVAVLSVAAIGPLGLAAAAVGMLAVLLMTRRRPNLVLARGRGASTSLMLGAQVWEATLLAGSAALAGLGLAFVLVPGRSSGLSAVLVVAGAIGAVLLLAGATWPAVRRPLDPSARDEAAAVRRNPRRLVLEVTAVGLAIAGIGLLQQRGLTLQAGQREPVRFDPFLAAVPVLTGFAAGIIAIRLYPFPIRAVGWLAARRRDLVPVLGLRSVGRRASFNTLPLLVLMLTAAFGSFALVVTSSLDRAQLEASWREVGADYRVQAPSGAPLAPVDPMQVPGVETVAAAFLNTSARLQAGAAIGRVQFEAFDAAAYDVVTAGAPNRMTWPAELLAAPAAGLGTLEHPIPVLISETMRTGSDALALGQLARVRVGDRTLTVQVVDVRATVPGHTAADRFVVASLPAILAAVPEGVQTNVFFVRGSPSAADGLRAMVQEDGPVGTEVVSRHEWYAGLRGAPLNAVIANGFRIGLIVAVAYAAFAVITALTLTAARRTQDLAFLRTLGMSRGQAAGVTAVEHGIPVLIALVPGIATGIAVALLLESSLGLDAFISPGTPYRSQVEWAGIASMALLLVIVVAVAVAISTWLSRRAPIVEALKVGEA